MIREWLDYLKKLRAHRAAVKRRATLESIRRRMADLGLPIWDVSDDELSASINHAVAAMEQFGLSMAEAVAALEAVCEATREDEE
jgi:hypothetical protein